MELLASPEVNGNLKDLVNSFVSTDRAKQAARQTISDTILNMRRGGGGSNNGSAASGSIRSPSPSASSTASSFSSNRGVSPLKSPMLASGLQPQPQPLSPSASSTSSLDSQKSLTPRPWSQSDLESIPIPVQHMTSNPGAGNPETLQSPRVLQNIGASSSGSMWPSTSMMTSMRPRSSNRNSLEFDMPLPTLHAANVERMRQRYTVQ